MQNLTQAELSSIRECVTNHQTCANKLRNYAEQCQDGNIKQMFNQAAQQAQQSAQSLIQML